MKIKFLADASLNRAIVTGVMRAEPSIDFLTASAAQLTGVPDEEVLAIPSREGRALVTHDIKTMPFYFAQYLAIAESPGVILISQKTSVAEAIESLLLVWLASEAGEWVNRICRLPF